MKCAVFNDILSTIASLSVSVCVYNIEYPRKWEVSGATAQLRKHTLTEVMESRGTQYTQAYSTFGTAYVFNRLLPL
jgi:hypothetical protein